jgi:uncharacterized protein DUF4124
MQEATTFRHETAAMKNLSANRFITLACTAAACALSTLIAPGALAAGMYKWTDDKGIVHYSDQMPPDAVNKGTTVFDKQGRPVKKIEAAPTAEELKAKELEEERIKSTTRQRDEQIRKDMALLQSYTSEDEIEFARARAISAVTNQIKAAEGYSADLTRRQQELEKQKAALNGKPVPPALENELVSLSNELGRQKGLLAQKTDELASINTRYDTDKRRWQDIRNDQTRSSAVGLETPKQGAKAASSSASK